jgi:hypothetical protein
VTVITESSFSFLDNPCLDWICPALLILDVMTQPILFDKDNLSESLKELIPHEENKKNALEHSPIFTSEIKIFLRQRFGFNRKIFNEDVDDASDDPPSPATLPLEIENGLTTELAERALDISILLLKRLKPDSKRATGVYQATMQLIVHLTRVPEV